MKRTLIKFFMLLVVMSMPLAAATVEGYLIDKKCSAKVASDGVDAAKTHTKDCALMPDCKSSGYGVVTEDGKFYDFDDDGDEMAVKMLGIDGRKDNIKVYVSGSIDGDSITVIAIQLG